MVKSTSKFSTAFLLAVALTTSACGLKNPGSSAASTSTPPPTTLLMDQKSVAMSEGGTLGAKTNGNYQVKTSAGQPINMVNGKTPNGYQVRLNIQGQINQ